ncbi:glycoside hydrolase family 78 protein [Bipolaris sorokiniana ND90Pr]|uniref:Glycoside hydrolase family 78 protein n=1 Tax=Cochliobolus sativus (strain ND90Pr / ATCC 201652) TaxID=665912 RepID=M2SKM3_COCSN|nr:glycoside hydrolase family 78 protein [Bipolaris sorokiniana ND90Pr]EMD67718.1 glycoside hydrolase family 78 protein [Bipolaris sorokiniana ND90Pr]
MMVNLNIYLLGACAWGQVTYAFVDYGNVYPRKYSLSADVQVADQSYDNTTTITLSPAHPVLTLDYGTEIAGFPFFVVAEGASPAQIEAAYSEAFAYLDDENADGPWTFSNGLANSWRVETFNITSGGHTESFFVQGGQRWQSIRLLTNHSLTLESIGFRATSEHKDVDQQPGHLRTSHDVYNKIFDLGGQVVQAACVDAGNAPSTWELTDEGAYIRGQTSAQSSIGRVMGAANYTLEFDTKIVRGGTGWRVASAIQPLGPYFVLTSNYPEQNTFVNTNRTLLPPNTLIVNGGWSLLNQSTLETPANQYYPLNISVEENKWYHIVTAIKEDGYTISLNGENIAFVPLPPPISPPVFFNTASRYEGTWGFGGFQDQIAVVANVSVVASNKTIIYTNDMKSPGVLAEYAVAPLDHSICLDGAKRDRLVWIGDFYHTVRVLAQSSARWDYIIGSIDYAFGYQAKSGPFAGFVPISARLGTRPEYSDADPAGPGLVDYQDLFLASIGQYYRYTGDAKGLEPYWENIKALLKARLTYIDPTSGLAAGSPAAPNPGSFLGPANGTAVTGLMSFALQQIVPLALAFQDTATASLCNTTALSLNDALNTKLWNPELGTYSLDLTSPGNFSLTGIAWSILSGAANTSQITSSLEKLEALRFGAGYKTISSEEETPEYQLAPNPSGFLLEALFQAQTAHGVDTAKTAITHLLDGLWGSMVNDEQYASGASWEYVKPDGRPGITAFTSLAHPWGAAPTYVLPEYLLGVTPVTAGYARVVVQPAVGYLGLDKVQGRVPTPFGSLEVGWTVEGGKAKVEIEVPEGIKGEVRVPKGWKVDGKQEEGGMMELGSGTTEIVLCTV